MGIIKSVLFAALVTGMTGGCGGRISYVVDVMPPLLPFIAVMARPGQVWVEGHWDRVGDEWVWREGYWQEERPGFFWQQGIWVHIDGRYHWSPGHWQAGSGRVRIHEH